MADDLPAHSLVKASPDATPERFIVFLHGILGQGNNWRGIARQLVKVRPTWGALLVDLRAHGDSRHLAPPDTLDAAADDVARLVRTLPVGAVLGHSFGGKVAVALLERFRVPKLFVVDSQPGARPDRRGSEGTMAVVRMLSELPDHFVSREAFMAHVHAAGYGDSMAKWLAMSLDRVDGGFRFGLDVARIEALLDDYFARDLFPLLDPPVAGTDVHLIIAGRSSVWSEDEREKARALAARHPDAVHVHVLERADHWVHVDDPEGLLAILEEAL
jgi:pimeloyl-ACP methyl ester carboxylesterase